MSAAARLLERLEGVRRSGDGWTARCPAHEDRHASLSVGEGAEGRALVHCHAGCATEEIVRRVGLELADLFPDDGGRREPRPGGGRGAAAGAARLPSEAEVSTWAARLLDNEKQLDVFLSRRAWTREAFELLGAGVADGRMTLPMRDAEARIVNLGRYAPKRAPGERKLYVVRGAPRVLFPAPESVDEGGGPLFLLEGEPDVLTGTSVGLACVGVPGVECWQDAWAERLAGRRVVVCFDCDEPGRRGAARVARSLAGLAADVRVLDLDPDRGDGFDLSDYVLELLGEDRSGEALAAARDRLLELAGQTEPSPTGPRPAVPVAETGVRPIARTAADVTPERVRWLWPGWLPAGKLVAVAGDPGLGKSTVTMDLAAAVTTGQAWPDGAAGCEPAGVVILSAEDGVADTIVPRLAAAGAELGRVGILEAVADEHGPRFPGLPDDVEPLARVVEQYAAQLVIIDPLSAYLAGGVDSHRDHDVRRALAPLGSLAEQAGACVLFVRHWNKSPGKSIYRGGGSIAFGAAVRVGLIVATDPDCEDGDRRVLAAEKSNVAAHPDPLVYSLVGAAEHDCARVVWHGRSARTADELARERGDDERSKLEEAVALLEAELEDGQRPARELGEIARRQGISYRTLQRARVELGVQDERDGFGGPKLWRLPEPSPYTPTPKAELGVYGESAQPCGIDGRPDPIHAKPGGVGAIGAPDGQADGENWLEHAPMDEIRAALDGALDDDDGEAAP